MVTSDSCAGSNFPSGTTDTDTAIDARTHVRTHVRARSNTQCVRTHTCAHDIGQERQAILSHWPLLLITALFLIVLSLLAVCVNACV
jgi:hypothetical protein